MKLAALARAELLTGNALCDT